MMENEDYKKSNREEAMTPKFGKFWCDRCDRCLVNRGTKCPVCGYVCTEHRLKKETAS